MSFDLFLILMVVMMTAGDRYSMLKQKELLKPCMYNPKPISRAWKDISLYSGIITFICWLSLYSMPNSPVFRYIPSILAIGDVLLGVLMTDD